MELWQTEAFKRWWQQDWSWDGLARKYRKKVLVHCEERHQGTLQDDWREEEADLVPFGTGADGKVRRWTCCHLPPFDLEGNECPAEVWTKAKTTAFEVLRGRLDDSEHSIEEMDSWNSNEEITQYAGLRGVVFPESFDLARRVLVADLSDAIFLGQVRLDRRAGVESNRVAAQFRGAVFVAPAYFADVAFVQEVSFVDATFMEGGHFSNASFFDAAWFSNASFLSFALFVGAKFFSHGHFCGAMFLSSALFEKAEFLEGANFAEVLFGTSAAFGAAKFSEDALFSQARFAGRLDFCGAEFAHDAIFRATKSDQFAIPGEVLFQNAKFRGQVEFAGRTFCEWTDFSGALFERPLLFHGADLHPETTFDRMSFSVPVAVQKIAGEWFGNAARENDLGWLTSWRRLVFHRRFPLRLRWPGMGPLRSHVDREMNRYELAFRTLRLQFAQHKNIEYEMMFYGLELDARRARASIPFLFEGLFAWLYKVTSDYGQNMLGPVVWFFGLTTVFAALLVSFGAANHYSGLARLPSLLGEALSRLGQTWRWLLQIQLPLAIWGHNQARSPSWFTALPSADAIETVLRILLPTSTLGLVTVFLIALRRRFQIGRP